MSRYDGYTEIANDMFRREELEDMGKVDRLVYITMLCLAINARGHVDAPQAVIASCAGITQKTVRDSMRRLRGIGAIKYIATHRGGVDIYGVAQLPRTDGIGFYKLPNVWLWESPLTASEKLVYLVLLAWRDRKTGIATPAYSTICNEARITRRAVKPAIARLEMHGLVTKMNTRRTGARQPLNRYRVQMPEVVSESQSVPIT